MRYYLSLFLCTLTFIIVQAEDLIITRTGEEFKGKLELLSESEVNFQIKGGNFLKSHSSLKVFPTNEIYMIKTDKRGSIFFNRKGERIMQPNQSIGKNADVIYLVEGAEISAWNIGLKDGRITYQKNPKATRAQSNIGFFPIEEVFMIRYNDGSKDIFTNISSVVLPETDKEKKSFEKKIKVIFYKILKGETLNSISRKYDVSVEDLIEWNDFSTHIKPDTKLTPGKQIMIQIETE